MLVTALAAVLAATPSPSPSTSPTPTPVASAVATLAAGGAPAASATASPADLIQQPFTEAYASCPDATICGLLYQATGNRRLGAWAQVLLGTPLKMVFVVLLAMVFRFLVHRAIERAAEHVASGSSGLARLDERLASATGLLASAAVTAARRQQRARAIGSILKSIATGVISVLTVVMVLYSLDIAWQPVLASFSIVGVAFGLGAQSLIKDFIAGISMIAEDQFGVGDVVELDKVSGVVEAVGLRITRLRDTDGTVWYVRNGEVLRVGNKSQGWARAVLDVGVGLGEDLSRVRALLLEVAREVQGDPDFATLILEDPEVWGVESLSPDGVVLRLVVKTVPLQQWSVARELRLRIKERFSEEKVEVGPWPSGTGSD